MQFYWQTLSSDVESRFEGSVFIHPHPHLHDLHLQVFMERWGDSDGFQHLAEQLLLQDLHLHGDSAHKSVLTQELLIDERQRKESLTQQITAVACNTFSQLIVARVCPKQARSLTFVGQSIFAAPKYFIYNDVLLYVLPLLKSCSSCNLDIAFVTCQFK